MYRIFAPRGRTVVMDRCLVRRGGCRESSFSSSAAASPEQRRRRGSARVLLVGSGRMGKIRASILHSHPRIDFLGVVDPVAENAVPLAERYHVPSFSTVDEAVEKITEDQDTVDALVVSSPTSHRPEIINTAAKYGLDVFTEKPVGETAPQIQTLFQTAAAANIALCCGFQRRLDPSYVAAAAAVQAGEIGQPTAAHLHFADHPVPPREFLLTGGDIFMDLAAHDVDYITHTLQKQNGGDGSSVVTVYAVATSSDPELAAAGVHDNATIVLQFEHGAVATLFLSRSAPYGYDQRCEIIGTKGVVSVGNVPEHTAVVSNQSGIHHARLQHSFPQRFEKAFALEMDAFCDTLLLENKPWPVSEEQCIRVQQIADAARQSARTGEVVRLDKAADVMMDETSSPGDAAPHRIA